MGLGSAYYLEKGSKDYLKYQLLRTAATFGFIPVLDDKSEIIMLSNGQKSIFVSDRNLTNAEFIMDMAVLRGAYNELRLDGLGELYNSPVLKSQEYKSILNNMADLMRGPLNVDNVYPEGVDPAVYVGNLLQDLEEYGKVEKSEALKQTIQNSLNQTIKLVKSTSWGNGRMAQSLEKYAENQAYVLNPQSQME